MASTLTVPVVQLEHIRAHPNADKLELCNVLGYQMVIPKGSYQTGDVVVYFPADTLIPDNWAEEFGVKKFLRGKDNDRVGKIKLRGEPSFGLVTPLPGGVDWQIGDNVADYYEAKKYEPPIRATAGDAAAHHSEIDPFISRYTDIENGRIHVDIFDAGEEVVVTEKIHGTNCKLGYVKEHLFASSMGLRRKRPLVDEDPAPLDHLAIRSNTYWFPWSMASVKTLLDALHQEHQVVTLYGEVFGGSIQTLNYGIPKGQGLGFQAFDLAVDGNYLSWDDFKTICDEYGVPTAPVLHRGAFDMATIKDLADGNSVLEGAEHIREGIVVKPVVERIHPKIGRVVLKYIGTEYELSKHKDKDTKDY